MGINEALAYIHNVNWRSMKPGLERIRELLAGLGNPEKKLRFVHIAGTNGKGSTAACIASVLQSAGYRTGLYTSPHLVRVNERMQAGFKEITDEQLVRITGEIRPVADAMADTPTEFEIITAIAMKFFLDESCDVVVLEVGMGGALDSTNVIEAPDAAVITAIGYDHVSELGPGIADIAGAKAGIIKDGCDVVIYGSDPESGDGGEASEVFERATAARGGTLHKTDFARITGEEFTADGVRFGFEPYGTISLGLVGAYQPRNAAVAITTLEVLRGKGYNISDDDIRTGLARVSWPGRFEILGRNPVFILDAGHNPQGMEAAAESIRRLFGERKATFLMGVMADKDVDAMLRAIAPLAESFIAVTPGYYRAMKASALAEKMSVYGKPARAFDDIGEGVAEALRLAGEDGIVCALGTLYFSGDVRAAYHAAIKATPPEETA